MPVAFAEGLAAAKAYATRDNQRIDTNRELVALGGANLASGLCSGMVVSGSLSKTAVNASASARTQLSRLLAAGLTVLAPLFLTGLFEDLPQATLAAIVIAAVVELVDVLLSSSCTTPTPGASGGSSAGSRVRDFVAAVAAMLGVVIFGTLPGLFIGIGVSLLLLIYRASRPCVACSAGHQTRSGRTATSPVIATPDPSRTSWSRGSRAACTSPTPTTSGRASSTPRAPRASAP